ncbi:MAG: hypothetical protein L3J82_00475 [Planctomycetes bacterium]|nr:hypothetical protein [Planctomycetota bacterium]
MVAGLNGLAYQSFEHAGNAGFPVAKANIANLCMQGPTPAAADAIMSSHKGKWYSNDLEYPYLIAGQAAKAMQAEQLQVSPMIAAGGQAFHVLADLLDRSVLSLETFPDMPDILNWKSFNVEYEKMEDNGPDGATYKLMEGKEFQVAEVKLETIYPFTRLYGILIKGVTWGYAMFDQDHQYSTFATKWTDSKPTVIKDLFEFTWRQD